MIEVRLKVPAMHIFIKGDLKKDATKKEMATLFTPPDMKALIGEREHGGMVIIPASNIAYLQTTQGTEED